MNCQLCDRPVEKLTVHHLVPRQHTKRRRQDPGPTVDICAACHKQIHTLFDNRYLAQELNSLDRLRSHPRMEKFLAWVRKQNPGKKVRSFRGR
ncbi:HNH endonuclease [filamentous cyanobacterium CCP5]|nr:HNH endonuclease [filamentous cyanobacterium CCP5]